MHGSFGIVQKKQRLPPCTVNEKTFVLTVNTLYEFYCYTTFTVQVCHYLKL